MSNPSRPNIILDASSRKFFSDFEKKHVRKLKEAAEFAAEVERLTKGIVHATPWTQVHSCIHCHENITYHDLIASRGICPHCGSRSKSGIHESGVVDHYTTTQRLFLRRMPFLRRMTLALTFQWGEAAYGFYPVYRQVLTQGQSPFTEPNVDDLVEAFLSNKQIN